MYIRSFNNATYQVGGSLGSGSYGKVYNCHDLQGNNHIVKFIRNPSVSLLTNEIKIMKAVRGKVGFAQIVDVGTHGRNTYFIIMKKLALTAKDV
jgi:serine/threonine protein kinase